MPQSCFYHKVIVNNTHNHYDETPGAGLQMKSELVSERLEPLFIAALSCCTNDKGGQLTGCKISQGVGGIFYP